MKKKTSIYTSLLHPCIILKGNNKVLKENLPNYIDFSNAISNPEFYQDNSHLNHKGSDAFSQMFIREYLAY